MKACRCIGSKIRNRYTFPQMEFNARDQIVIEGGIEVDSRKHDQVHESDRRGRCDRCLRHDRVNSKTRSRASNGRRATFETIVERYRRPRRSRSRQQPDNRRGRKPGARRVATRARSIAPSREDRPREDRSRREIRIAALRSAHLTPLAKQNHRTRIELVDLPDGLSARSIANTRLSGRTGRSASITLPKVARRHERLHSSDRSSIRRSRVSAPCA